MKLYREDAKIFSKEFGPEKDNEVEKLKNELKDSNKRIHLLELKARNDVALISCLSYEVYMRKEGSCE